MHKIIGETLYERSQTRSSHDIRVYDLGHGHTEAIITPHYTWSEAEMSPLAHADALMAQDHIWQDGGWIPTPPPTQLELLNRAAANKDRAARRATTKVRRLCKSKGLSVMLTLTYRECMTDRARMARDFDVFMKRLRRLVPGIEYVCVFELQTRGAWHAHVAVPRVLSHYMHGGRLVKSYDLLRSIWRAVVGADNGNVDVSRNKRVARSSARLASYISKYISKSFYESLNGGRDSYSASGKALPPGLLFRVPHAALSDAISDLMDLIGSDVARSKSFHAALLDSGGFFVTLSPGDLVGSVK
jgi:hypothetical protein